MKLNELEIHRLGQNRVCWTCGDMKIVKHAPTLEVLNGYLKILIRWIKRLPNLPNDNGMFIYRNIWPKEGLCKDFKIMLVCLNDNDNFYALLTIHTPDRFGFCAPYFYAERLIDRNGVMSLN